MFPSSPLPHLHSPYDDVSEQKSFSSVGTKMSKTHTHTCMYIHEIRSSKDDNDGGAQKNRLCAQKHGVKGEKLISPRFQLPSPVYTYIYIFILIFLGLNRSGARTRSQRLVGGGVLYDTRGFWRLQNGCSDFHPSQKIDYKYICLWFFFISQRNKRKNTFNTRRARALPVLTNVYLVWISYNYWNLITLSVITRLL